uniref:Uncharacterized protein n=1 Tax=Triticum urartu TaxID=4572 RepID=A0A8R7UGB7_TRIUA
MSWSSLFGGDNNDEEEHRKMLLMFLISSMWSLSLLHGVSFIKNTSRTPVRCNRLHWRLLFFFVPSIN